MKTRIFLTLFLILLWLLPVSCTPGRTADASDGTMSGEQSISSETIPLETPGTSAPALETDETASRTVPGVETTVFGSETESETESESSSETESEPFIPDMEGAKRIWVGDSRVVGLSECGASDPDEDIFIGKNGRYFVWFSQDALPVLKSYLDTGDAYEVIVEIGINDCANTEMKLLPYFAEDYAELINTLIDEYPAARFWFLSVGEVIGTYGAGTRWEVKMEDLNPLVEPFNETMREECRAYYLPVGELIKADQRSYIDNVHYTAETNQWIYDYVLSYILGAGE